MTNIYTVKQEIINCETDILKIHSPLPLLIIENSNFQLSPQKIIILIWKLNILKLNFVNSKCLFIVLHM